MRYLIIRSLYCYIIASYSFILDITIDNMRCVLSLYVARYACRLVPCWQGRLRGELRSSQERGRKVDRAGGTQCMSKHV